MQGELAGGEGGDVFGACLVMLVLLGKQIILKEANQALSGLTILHP